MRRIVFDVRSPNWLKYGVVIFVASDEERDLCITEAFPQGAVTITSDRPATDLEVSRHAAYKAWEKRWLEAAKTATAGRHMANP